jgi:hypothetical protein
MTKKENHNKKKAGSSLKQNYTFYIISISMNDLTTVK